MTISHSKTVIYDIETRKPLHHTTSCLASILASPRHSNDFVAARRLFHRDALDTLLAHLGACRQVLMYSDMSSFCLFYGLQLGGIHSAHRSFTLPAKHTGALSAHSGSRRRDPGMLWQALGRFWAHSGSHSRNPGVLWHVLGTLLAHSGRNLVHTGALRARLGRIWAGSGLSLVGFWPAQAQSGHGSTESGHTLGTPL